MKYFYFAVTVEKNGKYCAYVIKATESDNLLSKFEIKGIKSANIYPTKKRAEEVATYWNKCFKENGTYLFDNPAF